MDKYLQLLFERAKDFNIILNDEQLEQFKLYWQVLEDYNKHTNIVSSTEQEAVFERHFLDSLSLGVLSEYIDLHADLKLVDIGIGGGFPGIPLLIACPKWQLCGIDSVGKKIKFLELLTEELGIKARVELINARAEEVAFKTDMREQFDLAVVRAVGTLAEISEYSLPFAKLGGYFVAYRAKEPDREAKRGKTCG